MLNFNLRFSCAGTINEGSNHNFSAVNHSKAGVGTVTEKARCRGSVDPTTGCTRNTIFWAGYAHGEIKGTLRTTRKALLRGALKTRSFNLQHKNSLLVFFVSGRVNTRQLGVSSNAKPCTVCVLRLMRAQKFWLSNF